ncbi:hypothetical protein KUTeg_007823 [Tegillarca granosa]|uniref:Uncharacterized protein n=1 Tax=Tegillarca granosa TaxID=220873 RepID=A0ABQ9FIX6_TEGGR|nr:hypothetical protein KUTeg_007823 [Tegillarca granosa]
MTFVCWKRIKVISALVSPTRNCVHIYDNGNKQHVIRVPVSIVDTSLVLSDVNDGNGSVNFPEWKLYILAEDGCIYSVTESVVKNSYQRDNSSEVAVGNQEIFDDLINKDTFKVEYSSEPIFELSHHEAVFEEEQTVHSLKVSCGLVAIVTSTPTSWNIVIYPEKLFYDEKNSPRKQTPIFNKSFPRKQNSSEEQVEFLLYFFVSDLINTANCSSSDTLAISASFFKSLFGTEPGLLNSPVLMVCPPGGSVYYAPIKSLDESLVQPKVLCSLLCQVVKISTVCISQNQCDNGFSINQLSKGKNVEGLLIFATNGRCLLAKQNEDNEVTFAPMCMPRPVLDFDVHYNRLFVSSGLDVLESKFEMVDELDVVSFKLSEPETLMSANIQKIICIPKANETISERCDLLSQQLNGDGYLKDFEEIDDLPDERRLNPVFDFQTIAGGRIQNTLQDC